MSIPTLPTVTASVPARFTIWAVGVYAVVQGVGVCLGGIGRWQSPAFGVIRQVPGSPYSWGVPLAVCGLVVLTASLLGRFWLKAAGLLGTSIWSFAFGSGAFSATMSSPVASTTGGPAYLLISVITAILIPIKERRAYPRTQPR